MVSPLLLKFGESKDMILAYMEKVSKLIEVLPQNINSIDKNHYEMISTCLK